MTVVSIPNLVTALPGPSQPKDVVTVNDAVVRVARLERPETKQNGN